MSSEPTIRAASLTPGVLLKLAVAGTLSLAVVIFMPRTVSSSEDVPPVGMLLTTATIVGVICAAL